jgi:acetylornithine deacetylase/succinyl-diaminopimelate desuccinylase-like protein
MKTNTGRNNTMTLQGLLETVNAAEDEIVQFLRDLIDIPTVNSGVMPTGDELPLCRYLQKRLADEGIESSILPSAENRANLVTRLHGSAGRPRLLYMAHSDVVPVEDEQEWTYPPFASTVADGRVWGRGAADMKGMLAAEAMAMIILKRAGVELQGDLIFAAGADEETGGEYGFGWLAQHAPQSIAADFAVNEGGGAPIVTDQGLVYLISVGEKGRLEARISLQGRSGHAAAPWRSENVLFKLGQIIGRLEGYQPELDVSHPLLEQLPRLLGRSSEPITTENIDALADEAKALNPVLSSVLRGVSRMTIVPTMCSGGVKSNSIPGACTLVCDIRTLPHQDEAYVRRELEEILEGIDGVSYELVYTAVPSTSPYDTDFVAALRRAGQTVLDRDDLVWLPGLTTGFTDSRLVRPLGIEAYGFCPDPPVDPDFPSGVHGVNESVLIEALLLKTRFLVALAWEALG